MATPDYATTRDACDACAGRTPVEVTCSTHFIDLLFPEDEDQRKPRSNEGHRYYGGERG